MKFLLLRGGLPQDRNPQEIIFNRIEECDDVWTQLIFAMTTCEDQTEIWYWNGKREHGFARNVIERWVPSFQTYRNDFVPDVIVCRGGFREYHDVLNRYPKAFKIYYGAGRRFLPQPGFNNYDLILQDSPEQLRICRRRYPKIKSILFIKPAPDNIFFPIPNIKKEYDVCFPANGRQARFKGHKFVFSTMPQDLRILNLGDKSSIREPVNVQRQRVLRSHMSACIQQCRIGIVCSDSHIDSCPRVIPEMLACGIPLVVLNETRFWREKYIQPQTGMLSDRQNFWRNVKSVLANHDHYKPREYYEKELSLQKAAQYLRHAILT